MGRARKPLSQQKGNLTQEFQQQRQFEEAIVSGAKKLPRNPPKWVMAGEARTIWRKVAKELEKLDLLTELDENNFGGFCNAAAMYRKATSELEEDGHLVKFNGKAFVENPLVSVQRKYAQEMRDFAGKCGLTIDSRLKIAAGKAKEVDDSIGEEFGDI